MNAPADPRHFVPEPPGERETAAPGQRQVLEPPWLPADLDAKEYLDAYQQHLAEMLVTVHQWASGDAERFLATYGALLKDAFARLRLRLDSGAGTDASACRATRERLLGLATHDSLTGLPNRRLLLDRLEQALARSRRGGGGAVLFIDLDRFKAINDDYGHATGDAVLREAATRLRASAREEDTVSRLGGDEFVVVMDAFPEGDDGAARAADLAARIVDRLGATVIANGHELHLGASVGVAVFPRDGTEAKTLLRGADAALYEAKKAGRGTYRFFGALQAGSAPG